MTPGQLIRTGRELRGWDQAELARRTGVRQQTVSRWENDTARPRGERLDALSRELGLSTRELSAARDEATPAGNLPRPVRPLLVNLPVGELTPDQFEHFVADVAAGLHPEAGVSRFGTQGHTQAGIDVLVQAGEQAVATFQCKRHAQFGPAKVRQAVAEVSIEAPAHFLALSRTASPAARLEAAKHSGWAILDVEDLSRIVRQRLSPDLALRVVDTHFPGWREPFLGIAEPGVWQTASEFFTRSSRGDFYSHGWTLVGRISIVDEISGFAGRDGEGGVAVLVGRGGLGKTRLLSEVASASEASGVTVRFLATSGVVPPQQFEVLPRDLRLLVVIDDVHDRTDAGDVLAGIFRARPHARVLLASRPYGLAALSSQLRQLGLHQADLPSWELADLSKADAEALAREVLGPGYPDGAARQLASLTTDCPLVTVVGAVLVRRGQLDPSRLESDQSIQTEILTAFRDALVADPIDGDVALRRAVLDAIAALQPLRTDDPAFQDAVAALTNRPFDRAISHIRALEDAGVILRRSASLRIVPDLLGDVVLGGASFDPRSGTTTGYLERARSATTGVPLQNLFLNSSRVDWQISRAGGRTPALAEPLWADVEAEFRQAGIRGRDQLLGVVKRVAFYQPDRALQLARWAIDNPTDVVEDVDGPFGRWMTFTYDNVLHQLPPILKAVAYNLEYLPRAVDMLWELASNDSRPTNQHSDHALRALQDLATYEPAKPLAYNAAMLDAALRWRATSDVIPWLHSPFDVLEPLVATEGSEDSFDGRAISFRPFTINVQSTGPLRQRVIDFALEEVRHPQISRATRAVKALEAALRYPHGMFGRNVSGSEKSIWTPLFLNLIAAMEPIVLDPTIDPLVVVAVRRALNWHAEYSPTETSSAAKRVVAAIPATTPNEVALALHDGWGHLITGRYTDFEESQRRIQDRLDQIVDQLLTSHDDDQTIELLTERLQAAADGSPGGFPGQFGSALFAARPSIALRVTETVIADSSSVLIPLLSMALSEIGRSNPSNLMPVVDRLIGTDALPVRLMVASGLAWHRGRRELVPGEDQRLLALAKDEDPDVRLGVLRAAQVLSTDHHQIAVEIACSVDCSTHQAVAEEVCAMFGQHGFLRFAELSDQQQAELMSRLRMCPSIDGYHQAEFFARLSEENPDVLLSLLVSRVERAEDLAPEEVGLGGSYDPLPHHWDCPLRVSSPQVVAPLLRRVRTWIAEKSGDWHRGRWGGEILAAFGTGFPEVVLAVLDEALASGQIDQVEAAAAILGETPQALIWEHPDFVARALRASATFGEDTERSMRGGLHGATMRGGRAGPVGQPFPEDLQQRDRASEILANLSPGTIEHRFYSSLVASAEQSIQWSLERDDDLGDRRDW